MPKKYIDISRTIATGMKKYHSDPDIEIKRFKSIKKGGSCNLMKLALGTHSGTHVDAPRHILENGGCVDRISPENFFCKVLVANLRDVKGSFFRKINSKKVRGVLLKSGGTDGSLTIDSAKRLVKNNIKVIGTEALSIEKSSNKDHPVHKLLLEKDIVVLENLNLKNVKDGSYKLIWLPLKIKGADGSPVRAILEYD